MNRTEIKACTKTVKNCYDPNTFSYNKKNFGDKKFILSIRLLVQKCLTKNAVTYTHFYSLKNKHTNLKTK